MTRVARVENENVDQTRVTPTPPTPTEPVTTVRSTRESTQSGTASPAPTTTDETGPGFGAGVAVMAVLASALVGTRFTHR